MADARFTNQIDQRNSEFEEKIVQVNRVSKKTKGGNKIGFSVIRQEGSHVFLRHQDGRTTVVPNHPGENLDRGLLNKILKKDIFKCWFHKSPIIRGVFMERRMSTRCSKY